MVMEAAPEPESEDIGPEEGRLEEAEPEVAEPEEAEPEEAEPVAEAEPEPVAEAEAADAPRARLRFWRRPSGRPAGDALPPGVPPEQVAMPWTSSASVAADQEDTGPLPVADLPEGSFEPEPEPEPEPVAEAELGPESDEPAEVEQDELEQEVLQVDAEQEPEPEPEQEPVAAEAFGRFRPRRGRR